MKQFKRLGLVFVVLLGISIAASFFPHRSETISVPKGFGFGAPNSQTFVTAEGMYATYYRGYPVTYEITETFRPKNGAFNDLSYQKMPRNPAAVLANVLFWMALFSAILGPITIFWRSRQPAAEGQTKKQKRTSEVHAEHENTRD
ncbi:hypothetical protein CSA80_03065 [Candidatus Saccharibacteria bacterium]|nr:MAG: hypothetical protein CR973_00220 [Candidatus Saccharibacteria bacterium]PID99070.1 MAG: hypothetical protein CSA80_03065 [Candidatus Saccharibacteria bacterium]